MTEGSVRSRLLRNEHLVTAAAEGDRRAWEELVRTYAPVVWAVADQQQLRAEDAADVSQGTWLALADHLDRLEDPARVGTWLATTAWQQAVGRRREF
ncbi:MAG: sigma-70 region 2 domain protein [Frankiales bacterium]|nr:sigma-70 region 2 domain protein [Frankiales bacterium]